MKKFLEINFLLLLTVTSLLSCGEVKEEVDPDANALFFGIVYQVTHTRANNSFPWTPVSGKMQMKIAQSTSTEGTFNFYYENYDEPQFNVNSCSGGYKGNFVIPDGATTDPEDSGVYNPLDPYTGPPSEEETVDENQDEIAEIRIYNFDLTIVDFSVNFFTPSNCRQETNRSIVIYRFQSGQLLMVNDYREMQLRPVLANESIEGAGGI